jgi:hypothetical protein
MAFSCLFPTGDATGKEACLDRQRAVTVVISIIASLFQLTGPQFLQRGGSENRQIELQTRKYEGQTPVLFQVFILCDVDAP